MKDELGGKIMKDFAALRAKPHTRCFFYRKTIYLPVPQFS